MKTRHYLLISLLIVAAGFVAGSFIAARILTGPMRRAVGDFSQFLPATTETIHFPARDGLKLAGWFAAGTDKSKAVILLHGHGSTRRQMLARAGLLQKHGYSVLLYDARGHGESEGTLTSVGWYETSDLLGAMDWLRVRGYSSFGLIGASQGGATIAFAAPQLSDVKWSVLESVYPTMNAALENRFHRTVHLPAWLAGAVFIRAAESRLGVKMENISPAANIAKLKCPVLITGGEKDVETTADDTRELFRQSAEPKFFWLVPGATHVDLYGYAKKDYELHLLKFIQEAETHN